MDWEFDREEGYGDFGNAAEVVHMREFDYEAKKAHVKKLWQENPKKYYEWKEWCIARNRLLIFSVLVIIRFRLMNLNYKLTFYF